MTPRDYFRTLSQSGARGRETSCAEESDSNRSDSETECNESIFLLVGEKQKLWAQIPFESASIDTVGKTWGSAEMISSATAVRSEGWDLSECPKPTSPPQVDESVFDELRSKADEIISREVPMVCDIDELVRGYSDPIASLPPTSKIEQALSTSGFASAPGGVAGNERRCLCRWCSDFLEEKRQDPMSMESADCAEGRRLRGPWSLVDHIYDSLFRSATRALEEGVVERDRARRTAAGRPVRSDPAAHLADHENSSANGDAENANDLFREETNTKEQARGPDGEALRNGISFQTRPWGKDNQTHKIRLTPTLRGAQEGKRRVYKIISLADYDNYDAARAAAEDLLAAMLDDPDAHIREAKRNAKTKRLRMIANGTAPRFGKKRRD